MPPSFIKQAKRLLFDQKYDELLAICNDELANDTANVAALLMKGAALQALNKPQESIEVLESAKKKDPHNINVLKGLMRSYLATKNMHEYVVCGTECLYLLTSDPKLLDSKDAEFTSLFKKLFANVTRISRHNKNDEKSNVILANLFSLQLPFNIIPKSLLNLADEAKHNAVYETAIALKCTQSTYTEQFVAICNKQLLAKLSQIQARLKQSLNYTLERAVFDKIETLKLFKMEELLQYLIDTENQDDIRRGNESILLKLRCDRLGWMCEYAKLTKGELPSEVVNLRAEIRDLCERMVMFEPAQPLCFELFWDFDMPSVDLPVLKRTKSKKDLVEGINELKFEGESEHVDSMQRFVSLFPNNPLSSILLALSDRNLSVSEKSRSLKAGTPNSVFGVLLSAIFFTNTMDYERAVDLVHQGMDLLKRRVWEFDMDLKSAKIHFDLLLAQCYTYYDAPKNFGLATKFYDYVLENEVNNSSEINSAALVGKGLITSQLGEVDRAIEFFRKVVTDDFNNKRALNELSWLYGLKGETDKAIAGLKRSLSLGNSSLENAEIHWRIGKLLWDAGRRDQSCFDCFVSALESASVYAPAFTYLGLFYEEILGDDQRAQRCFYKALELDNSEVIAGERLASNFADQNQWDLVEIVATTVLSSKKLSVKDIDWPYKAMGIVCINKLKFDDAVKYFQHCLRSNSNDVQAWVGLGESYIHSGRYNSAQKALNRALQINPEDFTAHYVLSLAYRETLNFPLSADALKKAIKFAPESSSQLFWALADNCLRASNYFFTQSRLLESLYELNQSLTAILNSLKINNETSSTGTFWGLATEAMLQLDELGYHEINTLPDTVLELVQELKKIATAEGSTKTFGDDVLGWAQTFSCIYTDITGALVNGKKNIAMEKPLRVASLSIAAMAANRAKNENAAIEFYQQAIKLESRNESLWIGYGVVLRKRNPRVSQHCFIRALSINGRNTDTWLNLAALYLAHHDAELALEAVDRALSIEPDLCRAWVIQALAHGVLRSKDQSHIYRTLEHAYILSENDSIAGLALSFKEFETRPENPTPSALGALDKLLAVSQRLNNKEARLVMGLLLERRRDYEGALEHLCAVEAWSHVSRVQLALGQYKESLETIDKINNDGLQNDMEYLNVLIVGGLAHFFLNDIDSSIAMFTNALEEYENNEKVGEDVLRMLVEVLNASGSEDAIQIAQDQLFMSIEQNGATLQVTMLLGAFGLLSNDDVVKEAAREELKQLITPDLQGELLGRACYILHKLDPTDGTYQRAVFQWPTDYNLWRHADKKQALILAQSSTDPIQLSTALKEAGGLGNCQRAFYIDPLNVDIQNAFSKLLEKLN